MALSKNRAPETTTPEMSKFVISLSTAWKTGEV